MLLAILSVCFMSAYAQDNAKRGDYDVYLLIGQSNMAGRGYMIEGDEDVIDENVFILNDAGEVVPATNPLNQYSSIRKDMKMQRINPGFSFSKKIAKKTGRKVLLVVNARGGTSIMQWKKGEGGDGYYEEAVRRTKQAMEYGTLKAILWHQGESDSKDPSDYLDRLAEMVGALRSELGEVPFVAGEIAREHPNADRFNPVIAKIGEAIPHSDYVSSEGCTLRVGDPHNHFTREGQLILGGRYAEKVNTMIYE